MNCSPLGFDFHAWKWCSFWKSKGQNVCVRSYTPAARRSVYIAAERGGSRVIQSFDFDFDLHRFISFAFETANTGIIGCT